MSDIITARDPEIIAAEINIIKKKVQQTVIFASIEIGGKLMEAKSLVPQGEWGKWLENNVEYSQSTAENLMKLYKEYGGDQQSLFDTWTGSQTFGKLTYTQHLALLALPFSYRQEFAEQNNVEDMSTRQLLKAVQDQLEQERKEHNQTRETCESAEAKARNAEQALIDMQQKLSYAKSSENAWEEEINKLNDARAKAEKIAADTNKEVEKLQKQLKEVKDQEESVRKELQKAKENPEVPEAVMNQIRLEAEQEASKKAKEELQKKIDAAVAEQTKTAEKAAELEKQLNDAKRAAKLSDPVITETLVRAQKLQNDFNELNGLRLKQMAVNTEESIKVAGSMRKIMADMVEQMLRIVKA